MAELKRITPEPPPPTYALELTQDELLYFKAVLRNTEYATLERFGLEDLMSDVTSATLNQAYSAEISGGVIKVYRR